MEPYGADVLRELDLVFTHNLEVLKREQDLAIKEVDGQKAQDMALRMVNLQRDYSINRARVEKEIQAEVHLLSTTEGVKKLRKDLGALTDDIRKVFREATAHSLQKWRKDTEMLGNLLERHVMDLESLDCASEKFKSSKKEQINMILDLQTYIDGLVKHLNNTSNFVSFMHA